MTHPIIIHDVEICDGFETKNNAVIVDREDILLMNDPARNDGRWHIVIRDKEREKRVVTFLVSHETISAVQQQLCEYL